MSITKKCIFYRNWGIWAFFSSSCDLSTQAPPPAPTFRQFWTPTKKRTGASGPGSETMADIRFIFEVTERMVDSRSSHGIVNQREHNVANHMP